MTNSIWSAAFIACIAIGVVFIILAHGDMRMTSLGLFFMLFSTVAVIADK